MLLEDRLLRGALLTHLARRTRVDVSAVRWFEPEHFTDDGGRVDLVGVDALAKPLIVVEAKFGAILTPAQVGGYLAYQERRLGIGNPGVLVVLVPATRKEEGERILTVVLSERDAELVEDGAVGATTMAISGIAGIVVTWDEWLEVWEEAVRHLPATPDSLASDLAQLRALCRTLAGGVLDPVPPGTHRERFKDLSVLVDQITRRAAGEGRLAPLQQEVGYDVFRYIPGGYADAAASVGVALRFADAGLSPLWLRFHRVTGHFSAIRARIMTSRYAEDVRTDEGHLWIPLKLADDLAGPELVDDLLGQIREIQATISAPEWGR